jgi:hypothetical protein
LRRQLVEVTVWVSAVVFAQRLDLHVAIVPPTPAFSERIDDLLAPA